MKPALLRLAGTVMSEVVIHAIFHGASIAVAGWHGYGRCQGPKRYFTEPAVLRLAGVVVGEVGSHKFFHEATVAVVGWHGYGRSRDRQVKSQIQLYSEWWARLWARSGLIRYFTEPALLWLAGAVIGEVVASKIFNGAGNTVVGRHGCERCRGP